MGPLGIRLAPYGRVGGRGRARGLPCPGRRPGDRGVDLVVVETQTDLREMEHAVAAVRDAAPGLALVVSATFTRDDRTLLGSTPEQVATRLVELGVDAIGVNCGEGPAQVLRIVETMAAGCVGDRPLSPGPTPAAPLEIGGRFVYPATPGYMGEQIARADRTRASSIVGGCCGTGPAHTAAIVAARAIEASRGPLTGGGRAMAASTRSCGRRHSRSPWPPGPRPHPRTCRPCWPRAGSPWRWRWSLRVRSMPPPWSRRRRRCTRRAPTSSTSPTRPWPRCA